MTAPTPNTTSDYLLVDATESVTLEANDGSPTITVAHAKRSRIDASNQLTGIQPGQVLWDLAKAEVTGAITEPVAGYYIETATQRFVIDNVTDLVISGIWQCITTLSETAPS